MTLLHNRREVVAAFDFFTVPTLSLRALSCFFVIEHGRRRIFQRHRTPNCRRNCAATSAGIPRSLALPVCSARSRCEVRQGCRRISLVDRATGTSQQRPVSLAEGYRRKVGRQRTPRRYGPRHPAQRAASSSAHPGVRGLLSRGPYPHRIAEGHTEQPTGRNPK